MMKHKLAYYWKLCWIQMLGLQLLFVPAARADLAGTVMGAFQQGLGLFQSSQQQKVKQQQAMAMSMGSQQRPDDLGLGCSMLPPMGSLNQIPPCQLHPPSSAKPLPHLRSEALGKLNLFKSNAQLYKSQLQAGGDMRSSQGLKCLAEKSENLNAHFLQAERDLESLLAGFKNQDQDFLNRVKAEMNRIKDINALLEGRGASGSGQMDKKAIDYNSLFQDPACKQAISDHQVRKTGENSGLRGIRDQALGGMQDAAQEIQSINFKQLVQRRIKDIKADFKRSGLEGVRSYVATSSSGADSFGSLNQAYNKFYKDFNQEMQNVKSDLGKYRRQLGISGEVPAFDKNFVRELKNWENKFMNNCMSGKIPGGIAPGGINYMIGRLQRRGFNNQDQLLKSYQTFLRSLQYSQVSMDQKRASLIKFHQEKSGRSRYPVTALSREGGEIDLLEYFDRDMGNCHNHFNTLRANHGRGTGTSYKQVAAKAKQLYNRFTRDMERAVKARALRCEGITYNPRPTASGGCSNQRGGVLNRESKSFCKVHAQNCAGAVNSCFSKLNGEIKKREFERKQVADQVSRMMNGHRGILNGRLRAVVNKAKQFHVFLKKKYPFLRPLSLKENDLFIPVLTPEWNEQLKEAIVDGGNPARIQKSFERLISSNIKPALRKQRKELKEKIAAAIQEKKSAYRDAQKGWEKLAQQCDQVAKGYHKQMGEQNQKHQKDIAARNVICSITSQANATTCAEESLHKLDEAFTQLNQTMAPDPSLFSSVSDFKRECTGVQFIQEQAEENASQEIKDADIASVCGIGEELEKIAKFKAATAKKVQAEQDIAHAEGELTASARGRGRNKEKIRESYSKAAEEDHSRCKGSYRKQQQKQKNEAELEVRVTSRYRNKITTANNKHKADADDAIAMRQMEDKTTVEGDKLLDILSDERAKNC